MYWARENVFIFKIKNIGTRSEKGSPPLAYTHTWVGNHSVYRGVHPPSEAMMHFPSGSVSSPISDKFVSLPGKVSQFNLFPKKFQFSSAKISDDPF